MDNRGSEALIDEFYERVKEGVADRSKPAVLTLRLMEHENEMLERLAQLAGASRSGFARGLLVSGMDVYVVRLLREAIKKGEKQKVLEELAAIGIGVNERGEISFKM